MNKVLKQNAKLVHNSWYVISVNPKNNAIGLCFVASCFCLVLIIYFSHIIQGYFFGAVRIIRSHVCSQNPSNNIDNNVKIYHMNTQYMITVIHV